MIAVLAGNHYQYDEYILKNDLDKRRYFYVSSVDSIRGKRKLKYILYGSYYERKDFDKILEQMKIAEFGETIKQDKQDE